MEPFRDIAAYLDNKIGNSHSRFSGLTDGLLRANGTVTTVANVLLIDFPSVVFIDVTPMEHQGGERDFVSWSLTIAHRRLIDSRRASSRRPEVPTDPVDMERADPGDVEESALGLVEATRVRRLLDQLTADQADVLALRIFGELTLPEISHHLAKPLTAVTSLQHRGLERLRRLLTDLD